MTLSRIPAEPCRRCADGFSNDEEAYCEALGVACTITATPSASAIASEWQQGVSLQCGPEPSEKELVDMAVAALWPDHDNPMYVAPSHLQLSTDGKTAPTLDPIYSKKGVPVQIGTDVPALYDFSITATAQGSMTTELWDDDDGSCFVYRDYKLDRSVEGSDRWEHPLLRPFAPVSIKQEWEKQGKIFDGSSCSAGRLDLGPAAAEQSDVVAPADAHEGGLCLCRVCSWESV
jgi:hypothetical protein